MLKILVNAYAVCPKMGSEPGMGWDWCAHLAKHCELFIITEEEFRGKLEKATKAIEQGRNMHFFFNPVSEKVRKMCWNQGDWRFYKYYRDWQRRTYEIAKDICAREHIDIIHQLNMTGFREPGDLWKLSKELGIPYVWGPIGGMKQFPLAYTEGASAKIKLFFRLKNTINLWQIKNDRRVDAALRQASVLISATPDTQNTIKRYKGLESVIIPETGCPTCDADIAKSFDADDLHILWVSKFDFRKQLPIAIRAIAETRNPHVRMKIVGTGNAAEADSFRKLIRQNGVTEQVTLKITSSYDEIVAAGQRSDVFLFTSVNEETSTVVLEAMARRLPVICFDCCGMGHVITDDVGIKIPLSTPDQSVKDFAAAINRLYMHRDELRQLSDNCRKRAEELSWDKKIERVLQLYDSISNH